MRASFLPVPVGTTPATVKLVMPRCQAERLGVYLSDTPTTNKQCRHSARFDVGGKLLCMRHAEIAALNHLLENTTAAA